MATTLVAAYDPIFYEHHSFVDKVFAVWQYTHPKQEFNQPTGLQLPPFNNSTFNTPTDIYNMTNKLSNQTWDCRKEFLYDYDNLVINKEGTCKTKRVWKERKCEVVPGPGRR